MGLETALVTTEGLLPCVTSQLGGCKKPLNTVDTCASSSDSDYGEFQCVSLSAQGCTHGKYSLKNCKEEGVSSAGPGREFESGDLSFSGRLICIGSLDVDT